MYTGWRCPRCYRKSHKSSGNRRATLRTFQASSVLMSGASMPATTTDNSDRYNDPRNCRHCGYFTTTHPCTWCGKD
jgi:hypothetical protein